MDIAGYKIVKNDQQVKNNTDTKDTTPETIVSTKSHNKKSTLSRRLIQRIVPPLNFCPVERQLYRSGLPAPVNFPFLKQLNLKTILWLASEDPSDSFLNFGDEHDISFHFLGVNADGVGNPWDGLSENNITQALNIIGDKESYPLLVCCGMGRHRTGTVIGCLRRLQGWNLASVSEEYRRFAGSRGGRVLVELIIEAFDTSLVTIDPKKAPSWLIR